MTNENRPIWPNDAVILDAPEPEELEIEKKKYIENPKTKGSGIVACIPQTGRCPNNCEDCFFQSGRSYLEPLDENLPNIPENDPYRIVRVNDGNDSNVKKAEVLEVSRNFTHKFYNTAIPKLDGFDAPVVLSVNPSAMTNTGFNKIDLIPENLMFVRIRTNMWNLETVVDPAVEYYTSREVPVVLTFMAYFKGEIPEGHEDSYTYRKRTSNSYYAITTEAWEKIMARYKHNKWVHSCGKVEGELGDTKCKFCGNCIREYFVTMERTRGNKDEQDK
ncbi:MAG: hypothetical protein JSW62_05260 [Thermoplasmatales archaeon]|nr:MAG: hypothetical protein JSW62_05260 [Thermoplasmatales archaeon]